MKCKLIYLEKCFSSPAIIMLYDTFKARQYSHYPILLVASYEHLKAKRCLGVH